MIENQINYKPIEGQSHGDGLVVIQHDKGCSLLHLSSSLIDYEEPSKDDFDSIPHLILDQDESVLRLGDPYPHRENFDPAPNSKIISRFKSVIDLKTLPFYKISRSIIINCMGESTNFKSTLPS